MTFFTLDRQLEKVTAARFGKAGGGQPPPCGPPRDILSQRSGGLVCACYHAPHRAAAQDVDMQMRDLLHAMCAGV